MSLIAQSWLDDLLTRTDIVQIIGERLQDLTARGDNLWACCPFHQEKRASFSVSRSKQFYYCFGCGAKGNAIDFLMNYQHMTFLEAVQQLADHLGLTVPKQQSEAIPAFVEEKKALSAAQHFFEHSGQKSPVLKRWLADRGLDQDAQQRFGIGYAPDGWRNLKEALLGQGFGKDILTACGLLIAKEDGNAYDRFRNRIMFPIRDVKGQVVAFAGRALEDKEVKYINSPEAPWFHKGHMLYGMFEAQGLRKNQPAASSHGLVLVEGYMDVIALQCKAGVRACAVMGTALRAEHLKTLMAREQSIFMAFDGDAAGMKATARALAMLLPIWRIDRHWYVIRLPEHHDPDSLLKIAGIEAWQNCQQQAIDALEYWWLRFQEIFSRASLSRQAELLRGARDALAKVPVEDVRKLLQNRLRSLGQEQQPSRIHQYPQKTSKPLNYHERLLLLLWSFPKNWSKLQAEEAWKFWYSCNNWPTWWQDFVQDLERKVQNPDGQEKLAESWSHLRRQRHQNWLPQEEDACWREMIALVHAGVQEEQWSKIYRQVEGSGMIKADNMIKLDGKMNTLGNSSSSQETEGEHLC